MDPAEADQLPFSVLEVLVAADQRLVWELEVPTEAGQRPVWKPEVLVLVVLLLAL